MAHPLSQRALRTRPVEPTQPILLFTLQGEQFALPLAAVQRVIAVEQFYANRPGSQVVLVMEQGQEIPVIALSSRIFGSGHEHPPSPLVDPPPAPTHADPLPDAPTPLTARYLLLVSGNQGECVGLPLEHPPILRRIPESAFRPLSPTFQTAGSLHCVVGLLVPSPADPPIFLLNLAQLLQPSAALPPAPSK